MYYKPQDRLPEAGWAPIPARGPEPISVCFSCPVVSSHQPFLELSLRRTCPPWHLGLCSAARTPSQEGETKLCPNYKGSGSEISSLKSLSPRFLSPSKKVGANLSRDFLPLLPFHRHCSLEPIYKPFSPAAGKPQADVTARRMWCSMLISLPASQGTIILLPENSQDAKTKAQRAKS